MRKELAKNLLWLRNRLQEVAGEEAEHAVRQARGLLNEFPGPYDDAERTAVRLILGGQTDRRVRLELVHILAAMDDPRGRGALPDPLEGVDLDALYEFLRELDGHEVFAPDTIRGLGFSEEVVGAITTEGNDAMSWPDHEDESGERPGQVVDAHHLAMFLADQLRLRPTRYFIGRGSHTQELCARILAELQPR